ncbi:MAG TPA: ribosome small subunit-dependent GTPase A [Pyrinomonadaceae bacterium]|nr:ribosome small subunit-dependent GTPase A [Pyrinomonadaceae bacterium]
MSLDLTNLGWDDFFAGHFEPYGAEGLEAARVALEYNHLFRVLSARGELLADVAGKLKHEAASRAELPAVGDWVAIEPRRAEARATIHAVLPRKSRFVRKAAGTRTAPQVVGANIDTVFLVTSLNQDFNLRRLERYLVVARESGARPVVILSKADLCGELVERLAEIQTVAAHVPVHAVSVVRREGLEELAQYFGRGQTVALLGSSGVGKSTLINHLLGRDVQRVLEVRSTDDRGRHATTHRELFLLPQGGLVLDTPGMRELHLWDAGESLPEAFDDIEALVLNCRFSDCRHQNEPGCAIQEGLAAGAIDAARYQSYEKLQKELHHVARKQDVNAQITERKRWKKLSRLASERGRAKRR